MTRLSAKGREQKESTPRPGRGRRRTLRSEHRGHRGSRKRFDRVRVARYFGLLTRNGKNAQETRGLMKVIVADKISERGVELLEEAGWNVVLTTKETLDAEIADADALIVRSATRVTPELLDKAAS